MDGVVANLTKEEKGMNEISKDLIRMSKAKIPVELYLKYQDDRVEGVIVKIDNEQLAMESGDIVLIESIYRWKPVGDLSKLSM